MKKFALVGLIALVVGGLGTMFNWEEISGKNRGDRHEYTTELDHDQIENVDIKSDIGELNFYQTTEETIQIEFGSKSDKRIEDILTINETDDTLTIRIKHRTRFLNISFFPSWFSQNPILNIGLPESFVGLINASVDVGSIQINQLTIDEFNGFVNVGSITGNNLNLNQGSAEVDVGEIDLSEVTGEWYLDTDVGEIKLAHLDWQGKIEAHTDIGDIFIRIAEEPEYYSLSLDAELGKVRGVTHSYVGSRSEQDTPSLEASVDIGDITLNWGK